ncbi:hypothetical protein BLIN9172_03394, partial [Brevibacterium linens ATCC 9172]
MQDVQRQLFTESVMAEIELADTGATNAPDLREVLSALGLTDLSQRHPLALSGGQQQRLVVAACVAGRRIVCQAPCLMESFLLGIHRLTHELRSPWHRAEMIGSERGGSRPTK